MGIHLIGEGDWDEFKDLTTGNISVVQWSKNDYQHNCLICGGALASEGFEPWHVRHEKWCGHETIIMMKHTKDIFWRSVVKSHREVSASNKRITEKEQNERQDQENHSHQRTPGALD